MESNQSYLSKPVLGVVWGGVFLYILMENDYIYGSGS